MPESKIEWTERTWNPIVGCSILTPGCTNCYAMKMAARLEVMGNVSHYAGTTKKVKGNAVWTDAENVGLNWVIVGGESGSNARPFNLEWADAIVDQCRDAAVPCFVKQLGSVPMSSGYSHPLKSRKGGDPAEWPDRLNVRAMPKVTA